MPKKKSHEDFLKDVKEKHGDKYTILTKYKNAHTKIEVMCNKCLTISMMKPYSFIRQKIGCKKCYHDSKKLSFKDISNRLSKTTDNQYSLISIGKDTTQKIRVKHNCGYEYNVDFGSFFYQKKRCRKCYGTAPLSEQEFLDFFNKEMKGYKLISKFKKLRDRIEIKHLKCGKVYSVEPRSIKNQHARCSCEQSSIGERRIRNFLIENKIKFKEQYRISDCKNILPLPFDFKICLNNNWFLLEYQGVQHYKIVEYFGKDSFNQTQRNDKIKSDFCRENSINLEYITYKDDLEKELIKIINKYANHEPS